MDILYSHFQLLWTSFDAQHDIMARVGQNTFPDWQHQFPMATKSLLLHAESVILTLLIQELRIAGVWMIRESKTYACAIDHSFSLLQPLTCLLLEVCVSLLA
jgi:hypothetical protein